jgi:signal transduction histidine kinase
MRRGLSLANKCLLIFGPAIFLVVSAALAAGWIRMTGLIDLQQAEVSRQALSIWENSAPTESLVGPARSGRWPFGQSAQGVEWEERAGIRARRLTLEQANALASEDEFLSNAQQEFMRAPGRLEYQDAVWTKAGRKYLFAKAELVPNSTRLAGLVMLERTSTQATSLVFLNTLYLAVAGVIVGAIAVLAFYLIMRALILRPVRLLNDTAERVREGNLAIRSDLKTGDEFQRLAETFNHMLTDQQAAQDRLRALNSQLDMKLHELTEANNALFQAAKLKGEFLANVSHELRTPLNSIIGFTELLGEQAKADSERPDPLPNVPKRVRYIDNILVASRGLLQLINSLLEMARIEAGKVDLRVEPMNLRDACEGLLGLIAPLADKKFVRLKLEVADDMPVVQTDAKKFQQVIFNLLSNAVKFVEPQDRSGRVPQVTLRAERLVASGPGAMDQVRVSVIDNGPGIPKEEQANIFEKFYQLDGSHRREHSGTGLGLAICKELANVLHAEIQLVSEVGRGAMFSLIMPVSIEPQQVEETELESRFRGSLATDAPLEAGRG